MESENQPLLGDSSSGRKKKTAFCILIFLVGVAALSAAIVTSYFLYFKYVIGRFEIFEQHFQRMLQG
jgi:hypothetical protein